MGKAGPKSGLAARRAMVAEAGGLIETAVGHERNSYELWKAIRRQAKVATNNTKYVGRLDEDGCQPFESLTTHQKMKITQDFMATAFLQPEIGVRVIEAFMQDPIAFAKLTLSTHPKELHVDVTQQSGVVLLPMKAESLEAWMKTVADHTNRDKAIDVTPEEFWSKTLEVDNGTGNVGSDRDSSDLLRMDVERR